VSEPSPRLHDTPRRAVNIPQVDYRMRNILPERLHAVLKFGGRSVLDVGCGNGAYVLELKDRYDIRGVDRHGFPSWQESPQLFSIADAARLGFRDGSFDTILSFETLEHLQDPELALREFFRVCRRNLIITVPNCDLTPGLQNSNLIYSHWFDRTHVNFFTMGSIVNLVQMAGFRIRASEPINRLRLGPVVMEALGLQGFMAKFGTRLFRAVQRRQYPITLLIVGEKV
jgi:SAM-dependent methyltransferase